MQPFLDNFIKAKGCGNYTLFVKEATKKLFDEYPWFLSDMHPNEVAEFANKDGTTAAGITEAETHENQSKLATYLKQVRPAQIKHLKTWFNHQKNQSTKLVWWKNLMLEWISTMGQSAKQPKPKHLAIEKYYMLLPEYKPTISKEYANRYPDGLRHWNAFKTWCDIARELFWLEDEETQEQLHEDNNKHFQEQLEAWKQCGHIAIENKNNPEFKRFWRYWLAISQRKARKKCLLQSINGAGTPSPKLSEWDPNTWQKIIIPHFAQFLVHTGQQANNNLNAEASASTSMIPPSVPSMGLEQMLDTAVQQQDDVVSGESSMSEDENLDEDEESSENEPDEDEAPQMHSFEQKRQTTPQSTSGGIAATANTETSAPPQLGESAPPSPDEPAEPRPSPNEPTGPSPIAEHSASGIGPVLHTPDSTLGPQTTNNVNEDNLVCGISKQKDASDTSAVPRAVHRETADLNQPSIVSARDTAVVHIPDDWLGILPEDKEADHIFVDLPDWVLDGKVALDWKDAPEIWNSVKDEWIRLERHLGFQATITTRYTKKTGHLTEVEIWMKYRRGASSEPTADGTDIVYFVKRVHPQNNSEQAK
ncbi:hypothetical protein FISHEDRAFT_62301 [Fistulina hepatica ATCC 64428]|nr:hypothetical protein FISHEDRAFT_62301 [Fistulina hepatica ATCC 64428]